VVSLATLCPQFDGSPNTNLFCYHFGMEFNCNKHTYVRKILPLKNTSCFSFANNLRYRLLQPDHWFALDAGIPALTSACIFDHIYERLHAIRNSNTEISPPRQYAAPAAHIIAFVNSTIATRLPDWQWWVDAYNSDPDLLRVWDIVRNPATLYMDTLKDIPFNYHSALQQALIMIDDDMLIYRELIAGGMSFTKLILVPSSLHNILSIAFHSNALGSHFDAYRTLQCLCLCYYWPGMYTYIKRMCLACPGCALSNPKKSKSSKLVYNFSIEALFMVLHVDAYMAGSHPGFEDSEMYLVACCGICTFGTLKSVSGANATTFASAIVNIQLCYGFCHTIILDMDRKFYGVCCEALNLLKINCHVLSEDNHNPMLVEHLCQYFNKGLTIMCNERATICVALECLLLLLYAWNSYPLLGTDISRSLVAVGCKFAFLID
jgi:hypothetical protein